MPAERIDLDWLMALEALAIVRAADELEALGEISATAPKGTIHG